MKTNKLPEVRTEQYEFSHGHAPRGRGSWAFHPDFNVDALSSEIFWFNGTYAEAKKAAREHFRGHVSISPLS